MKAQKGSGFERKMCRELSSWWSKGTRDDLFWRSAGSGAMAKSRSKTGKTTFGQYGDVQATDPEGQPLLDLVTIELKRGYNHSTIQDVMDCVVTKQQYEKFLDQVSEDSINAGTPYYLLIVKRDRRLPLVFMPMALGYMILEHLSESAPEKYAVFMGRNITASFSDRYRVYCVSLQDFVACVQREDILEIKNQHNKQGAV